MKQVFVLWHGAEPIGICIFCTPAFSLRARNRYFGLKGSRTRLAGQCLNHQLLTLSRVVLHPKYRGAGLASPFIRRCCELTGVAWIEALAQMGQINPFFERAGFVRVGVVQNQQHSRQNHSDIYGNSKQMLSAETHHKSLYSSPVYYVFDNRSAVKK